MECVDSYRRWTHDSLSRPSEKEILAIGNSPGNHWIPEILLSFVAISQHYGIPTRLLDWSYSPFVAAYFAARDAIEGDAERFSVHALFASGLSIGREMRSVVHGRNLRLELVTVPRAANPNLHAQEGIFTYLDAQATLPLLECRRFAIEDVLSGLENPAPQYAPLLYKFSLERTHAPEVLWYLDKMGYHAARLFPGFEGSAKAVFEFSKMMPPPGD